MKTFARLIVFLFIVIGSETSDIPSALAQAQPPDPIINLIVKDEPLIDVLEAISQDTGYQFNLPAQWEDHRVSANIKDLPLERGLKRLLRSLNHTILWEADQTVTIKVYGPATPGDSGGVSFSPPPQPYQEEEEAGFTPDDDSEEPDNTEGEGQEDNRGEAPPERESNPTE